MVFKAADGGPLLSSFIFPPSSFPLVPLGVPYWNGATYGSIFKSIVSGHIVVGRELSQLKASVIETLGVVDALLCGSGSLAIEIILRACGIGSGNEVVIPTFCCTAVVPPILAVGATPVLADIGEELNLTAATVDAVLTQKTRAVIVPHLYGNPADIQAIIALVRGKNIQIIDDAAQALGATIDGQPVGSFGAAGIVSFGREKVCAGLGGGAVISRNRDFFNRKPHLDLSKPAAATARRNLLRMLVCYRWRRWTWILNSGFSRGRRRSPNAPLKPYRKETMANLDAAVAFSLMQTLGENVLARRARVRAYHELLDGDEGLKLVPHRDGSACLNQVVRVLPRFRGDERSARVIQALKEKGYELQGSYVPIHLLPGYEPCVWDRLSYADDIWTELIELPCEPEVSLRHVERIAAIVKRTV